MAQSVKGRLGDRLIDKGVLNQDQLEVALNEQRRAHRPLGEILISLGFCGEGDITALSAEDMGLEFLRPPDVMVDPTILAALDPDFVRETMSFPFALDGASLRVVMADPDDPDKVSAVRRRFPYPLIIAICTEKTIHTLLRDHIQSQTSRVSEIFAAVAMDGGLGTASIPVEALVQAILLDGVHRGATDIHVEPEEHVTRVRYRVDGLLQPGENLPFEVTPAVISRLKILSSLDISERRRPQDGRLRLTVDERDIDMRVSVMPCTAGENVVLRILDSSAGALRLDALGVATDTQRILERIVQRPHGIFLVTGPTGSGKTTTLYAMLSQVDAMHRNVATVEDPVEYRLPLLRQSQVDPSIGFSFHEGLRALLRQDPDVILIGEIRDRETADMAIKAAMTGHLVLSTLHTNSAIGAVPRLVDIGIEPYLIEDSLIAAMGQRLVRTVCSSCGESRPATEAELVWLGVEAATVRSGSGCARCDGSGYAGRTSIVELFMPDESMADALRGGAGLGQLAELAYKSGFRDMLHDGQRVVLEGRTTMEEVERVHASHRLSREEREDL